MVGRGVINVTESVTTHISESFKLGNQELEIGRERLACPSG
jgi:hypothetical protein